MQLVFFNYSKFIANSVQVVEILREEPNTGRIFRLIFSASGIFFGFSRQAVGCFRLEYGGQFVFMGRNNMKEFGACG